MNIGDKVRVERMPDGLPPDNKQLQTLFSGCVGKTFPIVKFDGDLIELHVGEVFGKPQDEAHARSMLRRLSGSDHRVYRGVCVWRPLAGGAPHAIRSKQSF